LIDENVYKWFLAKIDGVENLSEIRLDELLKVLNIYEDWGRSAIFRPNETYKILDVSNNYGHEYGRIKNCHVQKIGDILSKADVFSIYNLELQVYAYIFDTQESNVGRGMVVSIGNSNNYGITN